MNAECLPISAVPGLTRIFADFCGGSERVQAWYGAVARDRSWFRTGADGSFLQFSSEHRNRLVNLLASQNPSVELAPSLDQLRRGAKVAVTGQQVGLFGGPALTLHKAATAIALAKEATAAGNSHVPVFWLASEDHDFAEINHVELATRNGYEKLAYGSSPAETIPVGKIVLDAAIEPLLEQASELLGYSDVTDWLNETYRPGKTLAQAFAEFYGKLFASQGLLILDAAEREAHALGAPVLQAAIERADELHAALLERNTQIEAAGYHAQVAVGAQSSVLFLIDPQTGARLALKRTPANDVEPKGMWQAGRQRYSTDDLLGILKSEPERISPSALLRPVFQDAILPTSAYVGGPAEVAYFAQSSVLYQRVLGRVTPVIPRLSVTLVEPAIAKLLDQHEISIETIFATTEQELAQRLAARAMPVEGKQKLAAAGNALDRELSALTDYLSTMDEGLGRAAGVSASKMRYQMNRLRRLSATFELQKNASLARHAQTLVNALYPHHGLQERFAGAASFAAKYGTGLIQALVEEAHDSCPGHKLIRL